MPLEYNSPATDSLNLSKSLSFGWTSSITLKSLRSNEMRTRFKNSIRNVLNLLYEKDRNPNIFSQYLYEALDKFNDYSKVREEEENKIDDYISRNLNQNPNIQKGKNELKKKYEKNNYIIEYKDFTQIVKDFNIEMDNLVIEYLLYKMKCGIPLEGDYSLDNLNFNIFLDYLDNKMDISESNILKESVIDNKIEQIGIVYKNKN